MSESDPLGRRSRYELLRELVATRPLPTGQPSPTGGPGASDRPGVLDELRGLCSVLVGRLSVAGAAIHLMSDDGLDGVIAGPDPVSLARAELSFTTDEGPSHDAFTGRRPVLVPDLTEALGRWPGYTSLALAAGARAVFAFPLVVGAVGFGVLHLFAETPGALDDEQVADALTFARLATDILLAGRLTTAQGHLYPDLDSAMDLHAEIHQAEGMLMVSLDVSLVEAVVLMRSYAFGHNRSLVDVAQEVQRGGHLGQGND